MTVCAEAKPAFSLHNKNTEWHKKRELLKTPKKLKKAKKKLLTET